MAEPTRALTIMAVTSATGRSAEVVRTLVVMMSRSWATVPPCACRMLHSAAAADLICVRVM
jgi:hypothetical protein